MQIIKFYDAKLLGEQDGDSVWIPVKPICDAIGIDRDSQVERIKNDRILGQVYGIRQVPDRNGRAQKSLCLPIDHVHGWLFSVEFHKVKPEIQPRLLLFKQECYTVLYEHFFGNARRTQVDAEREHYLLGRNKELNRIIRESLEENKTNALEIQAIQNRRAQTYHLEPLHTGAEFQLSRRRFPANQLTIIDI